MKGHHAIPGKANAFCLGCAIAKHSIVAYYPVILFDGNRT